MKDAILEYAKANDTFTVADLVEAGFKRRLAYYHIKDLSKRKLITCVRPYDKEAGIAAKYRLNYDKTKQIDKYVEAKQAKNDELGISNEPPIPPFNEDDITTLMSIFIGENDAGWKPLFIKEHSALPVAFALKARGELTREHLDKLDQFKQLLERTAYIIDRFKVSEYELEPAIIDAILENNRPS